MHSLARSGSFAPHVAPALIVLTALLATACAPGGDPVLEQARAVLDQTAAQNPEYERYALSIAAGNPSPDVLRLVLTRAESENFQTAIQAVQALGETPPEEAREVLQRVYSSKSGALKRAAAIQLARMADAEALAHLEAQLADPAQEINVALVPLLAQHMDLQATLGPTLQQWVRSEDLTIRNEAYVVLGEVRQPWATGMLAQGLRQEHGEERQQAIHALGRTGDPAAAGVVDDFVNTQGLVFVTLEALGELGNPDSLAAVEKMIGNDEPSVRVYAAVAAWRLGEAQKALPVLDAAMQDPDPTVRKILAGQLGAVADDENARSRLAALAEDEDKDVRVEAVRAVALHADPAFEEVLVKAAQDGEYEVATLALDALGSVGRATAVETIAPLLASENPYVAISAAEAVLAIRARQAPAAD